MERMWQCMDEYDDSLINPDLAEPSGDVDDLIFFHDPDWYASDR